MSPQYQMIRVESVGPSTVVHFLPKNLTEEEPIVAYYVRNRSTGAFFLHHMMGRRPRREAGRLDMAPMAY